MAIEPSSHPIPTEKGWPLLGVLPNLLSGDPFEYLKSIMVKHGGFVQLNIATKPVYLVSDPDYLKRILQDHYSNYRKPEMMYDTAREVMGNGLALSSGDFWLRQRRMIQPHMHRKQLVHMFEDMVTSIDEVLEKWEPLVKSGAVFDLDEKMGEVTIAVTARTMFGSGTIPPDQVTTIGHRITELGKYNGKTAYSSALPKWVPIPGRKEFERNLRETRETINQIIDTCRQQKESSASLIQMLIHSVDEESQQQMTEQQLFDEVMTIFIAGYETTATVLTWLGVVINNHPEVLEKIQAEIQQVLGERTPTFEDVPKLAYIRQVFMEVLRMYTAVPFLPRATNQADQLGPYQLPAEAMVLVFYLGVHHNPLVWDDPESFNPDRFTAENMANQHPFAYVPFSGGPRKCAGNDFALLEGTLAIAMIFQKYDIKVLPNQTFPARVGSTLHPRNGVKVVLSLRENS